MGAKMHAWIIVLTFVSEHGGRWVTVVVAGGWPGNSGSGRRVRFSTPEMEPR